MDNLFSTTLAHLRKGAVLDDASEQFRQLIEQVKETGLAGELNLKLTIKPVDPDGHQVQIIDQIKVTPPKRSKGTSLFFTTDENGLSRNDPDQGELFSEVDEPEKPGQATA